MSLLTSNCNRRKEKTGKEERRGVGTGDAPYSPFSSRAKCNLFTPPPPTKNVAIVFHFSGSTVIPRRDWSCKILGLKKVHYGFVEMVNRKSLYALCVVLLYKYYYVIV